MKELGLPTMFVNSYVDLEDEVMLLEIYIRGNLPIGSVFHLEMPNSTVYAFRK